MPPVLETNRMVLRVPRNSDLNYIHRLGANPHVMQYITSGKLQSLQDARADLSRRRRTARCRLGYWVAEERKSGAFIGWMALKQGERKQEAELGYRFLEEQWGRGFATEGSLEILDYAFRELRLEKVIAVSMEENRASTRVMEKLGMSFCGHIRAYGRQCVRYEIVRRQFEQRHYPEMMK
ncbi:MAG: GNAT family N-acetyltransferase [Lewinellaceae bacterium]|nr:GNAT family N-acetyltransferase [Lewinellaceae bacterium]